MRNVFRSGVTILASLVLGFAPGVVLSQATTTAPAPAAPAEKSSEINKPFEHPDVDAFVKRFENESREVYAQRQEIVKALGLRPGMSAGDIGAGTGLFTQLIAEQVGTSGKVYAVDISSPFLKHIAAESSKKGRTQVTTVRSSQESTNLPAGSLDVAFLCDVYHHLEHHDQVLASIHQALRPGGRLIVIEFDRERAKPGAFVKKHVRADKGRFIAEIKEAGFEPIPNPGAPKLSENFFAEFRRVETLKSMP